MRRRQVLVVAALTLAATRAAFEALDAPTAAALDPVLLAHRDMMYARHLALPLQL